MTKFCLDLIKEQIRSGCKAAMIWPGQMGFFIKRTTVRNRGTVIYSGCDIQSFEIINPLPVSLDEGILETGPFLFKGSAEVYNEFLSQFQPDVLHIHTFMGLHISFLREAKKMGIKLVFSAHDFFPVCSKITLFKGDDICKTADNCRDCPACNSTALSIKKITLMQSPLYRSLKNTDIVKKLRKRHRDNFLSNEYQMSDFSKKDTAEEYLSLRRHYGSMLDLMDCIHFNSDLTKSIYDKYFKIKNGCTIHISHGNISDNKRIKDYSGDTIRFRYMGPYGKAKGFIQLKNAMDRLWKVRQDFSLDIHFDPPEKSPYMIVNERYGYEDLKELFNNTDACIIPSVGYETFGYTVLEPLSYGVPVIVTDRVGAKEILADSAGIVVDNADNKGLFETLRKIDRVKLSEMNRAIVRSQTITVMEDVSKKIADDCYCS